MSHQLKGIFLLGFLSLFLMSSAVTLAEQPACTITLDPSQTVQETLDTAQEGSVICLVQGEWHENLRIEKSLTLRGQGADKTVIQGQQIIEPVVQVNTPDKGGKIFVVIENLTLTGSLDGARFQGSVQARIVNSTIRGNYDGVSISESAQANIESSTFEDNQLNGVSIWGYAKATISNCKINSNQWYGLWARDDAVATITDCILEQNGYGIRVLGSAKVSLEGSTIKSNSHDGILIGGLAQATIIYSTIRNNNHDGIWVEEAANLRLESSIVEGNKWGIGIANSARAYITASTIKENHGGIGLLDAGQADIQSNSISANLGYGIAIYKEPCFSSKEEFIGYVTGRANSIPGNSKHNGNGKCAVCPVELFFLTTEGGGRFDKRLPE